jgi:holin-like protein
MLGAVTLLLVYQLAGEALVLALGLPVPGPVIGLALLFVTLVRRGAVPSGLRETANGLLSHLSLLFVPAGTGVMVHFARIGSEWLPIVVALVGSTLLTIAVTGLTMRALLAREAASEEDAA